jgi:hypothetical protein
MVGPSAQQTSVIVLAMPGPKVTAKPLAAKAVARMS